MKKRILAVCLLLLFFFPLSVSAFDESLDEQVASQAGLDGLSAPGVDEDELAGKDINLLGKILSFLSNALSTGVASSLRAFAVICSALVFSAVFASFKWTTSNQSLHTAYEYVSVLVLAGITFTVYTGVFHYVAESILNLTAFMTAMLPVTSSLYLMGGNAAVSAVSNSAMLIFFSVMSNVANGFLMPFLQIAFALSLASAIPGTINLTSISTLVRNTTTTVLAFLFSLFSFTLYLQTTIAAASDTYVYRSARFASGVFVPVIGSILGDASRTVAGSISVIKSAAGAVGITAVLAIVIPPIVLVVLYKLTMLGCAIVARALGCERESRFLYELNGIMNVLMSLLIGLTVVLIIALGVFIRTGVSV